MLVFHLSTILHDQCEVTVSDEAGSPWPHNHMIMKHVIMLKARIQNHKGRDVSVKPHDNVYDLIL